jgi:glycosyltransferase involved in cell wall biosynthesis
MTILSPKVGVVIIGRNEGNRLTECIRSVSECSPFVVYVDSGSTDGSTTSAKYAGATVVELNMALPFTAARARNEGFRRLRQIGPELPYVQFVDGDCEVTRGWLPKATAFLDEHEPVAVVCGRRRERFPSRSIYIRLCDSEWNTPIGETKACGGDALIRAEAFEQVGGYRKELIAGEEPELCVRLRAATWKIWRIDAEMTLHNAAITRFGQWWLRHVRSGYAFAQGAYLHGAEPERHWVWESLRALFWGAVLPLICLLASAAFGTWGLNLWLIYPLQLLRRTLHGPGPLWTRLQFSFFELLARFPEALGQFRFLRDLAFQRHGRLIEYK